jgi:hypothetical protein
VLWVAQAVYVTSLRQAILDAAENVGNVIRVQFGS